MNNYMELIGIKAKKSCENRLNTKKKNLVLILISEAFLALIPIKFIKLFIL